MAKKFKYELAFSDRHNCTDPSGHKFVFIKDKEKREEIRKEHPRMVIALWECRNCGKITQSM